MSTARRSLALLALLLGLGGQAWAQGFHPGDAARVNGEPITYQRFNGFYAEYRTSKGVSVGARGDQLELMKRLRKEAMDQMIEQELVRQAALEKGITADPEEAEAEVKKLRDLFDHDIGFRERLKSEGFTREGYIQHVQDMMAAKKYLDAIRASVPPVTDEALEAYYNENTDRLTFPEQVRVRHILLTWKALGTRDDRAALREQMTPILERARSGEDFAALAREYSEDAATRDKGGDTGLFHRGQMVPVFEQVAFSLKPGQVSDMVETPYGVHIMRLEEHLDPYLLPLDEVRDQLRDHVFEEQSEEAVQAEIARLRAEADIEIIIPLSETDSNRTTSR